MTNRPGLAGDPFIIALIVACIVGIVMFPLIEQRTPIGGDHPQIIAINR